MTILSIIQTAAGHDDLRRVLHGAALLQPAQPHQADHGESRYCIIMYPNMCAIFDHVCIEYLHYLPPGEPQRGQQAAGHRLLPLQPHAH